MWRSLAHGKSASVSIRSCRENSNDRSAVRILKSSAQLGRKEYRSTVALTHFEVWERDGRSQALYSLVLGFEQEGGETGATSRVPCWGGQMVGWGERTWDNPLNLSKGWCR